MSSQFSVMRGVRMRITRANDCGAPVEGPKSRQVLDTFVSLKYTRVVKAAEEKEQKNANGDVCASDRTPEERKWYDVEMLLCGIDPETITNLTGYPVILDHNDQPVGYGDRAKVAADYGAVLEIWTLGKSVTDCAPPTSDSYFSRLTSGKQYGYFIIGIKEAVPGDMTIEDAILNVSLKGISMSLAGWGKGPYNVVATDDDLTPGRLLTPMPADRHNQVLRTMIPPPPITDGAVALNITNKFVDPDFYYGGEEPNPEPPADVAPEQDLTTKTLTFTGTGTAGGFELTVSVPSGGAAETTATIPYNPTASQIQDALNALPSIYGVQVTGTGTGPFTVKLPGLGVTLTVNSHITGGSVAVS